MPKTAIVGLVLGGIVCAGTFVLAALRPMDTGTMLMMLSFGAGLAGIGGAHGVRSRRSRKAKP